MSVDIANNPNNAFGFNRHFDPFPPMAFSVPRHYLLYATNGAFHLEVDDAQWLLPPHRAAWIVANEEIQISADAPITTASILFKPEMIPPTDFTCRVFAVTPLVREMIHHAMRWGPDRDPNNEQANVFFQSLADVCAELVETPVPFWLPRATSAELREAMTFTLAHLSDETLRLQDVAEAAGISERTLARRFSDETNMTWRQFTRRARMIQAMERLADGSASVTRVALDVGFNSPSAFTRAFQTFTGETPSQYQNRFGRAG